MLEIILWEYENLILMFFGVVDVLETIKEDGIPNQKVEAQSIMRSILSFEFVFALYLMKNISGITNELSTITKKKKKKIVNIMTLVEMFEQQL